MKNFTLLSVVFFFSLAALGQTPCSPISPLDCAEVEVSLPVNFDFNSSSPNTILDNNNLGTGFTAVLEHSENRKSGDIPISNPLLNGYEPSLLSLSSGSLEIVSQGGIAFLNPPASSGNNNQVNTLGVGLNNLQEKISIRTTMLNITTGGGSAQAGIWYGYDEDNFVKLNVNDGNIELRTEIGGLSNNGTQQVQQALGASGQTVQLEMVIDPIALNADAYYTIGTGSRTLLGSLPIPAAYITGRDIDGPGAQNNVSFAGIYATHRNGAQFTARFDEFSVEEVVVTQDPFAAFINFQNNPSFTTPPAGYLADYGKAFGNASVLLNSTAYAFGWKELANGNPIDVSNEASNNGGTGATGGAGRNRVPSSYATASLQEKLEGTLMHFQGDNIRNDQGVSSWAGQPRGNELIWEIEIPNGVYEVTVGLGDKSTNQFDSRHSATVEGYTIIPAFIPTSTETRVSTMIVQVSDGFLTINGVGGYNSKITHIDIVESNGVPVSGTLAFDPNTATANVVTGTTGVFSSTLSGSGATVIGLAIDDNVNVTDRTATGTNGWLTLPSSSSLGSIDFIADATALVVGDTRANTIIATAAGFTPAVLNSNLIVVEPASVETDIVSFSFPEETSEATIDAVAHTVTIEVVNGTVLTSLTPDIVVSNGATIDPLTATAQDFSAAFEYTVTAEDEITSQIWTVTVSEAVSTNTAPVFTSAATASVEENQTAAIDVNVTDDVDAEGPGLQYTLSGTIDDGLFDIDVVTGVVTFKVAPDFEAQTDNNGDNVYEIQVTVTDSGALSTTQDISITVTDVIEIVPFVALINFQNNPSATTPPTGYAPDYGKGFGNASISLNGTDYAYGWKLLSNNTPWDASEEAANNSSGVGRLRLANVATYDNATLQEKLEGTLVHFQGDNIDGWGDGQPRKNELYWELEVPNGIYEVTLGLGDKSPGNVDSRHTATLEGYTIIPAFRPNDTETRVATMIVAVTDGALTMNGLGGFNSKITHIQVQESTGTPVDGALAFTPNTRSTTLEAGVTGTFTSTLSGDGATDIALNIEDDPINEQAGNTNDWLSLPATNVPGEYTFITDATTLTVTATRADRIIATATGFSPAILNADIVITAPRSTETDILTFLLTEQTGDAVIDSETHTITVEVSNGTDFSELSPAITVSEGASFAPGEGVNSDLEDGEATYTVTAEDEVTEQVWTVTITEEAIATIPPVVVAQTFEIAEDAAIGTSVGTIVATDEDTAVADLSFSIIAGNENGAFTVDGNTGELSTLTELDAVLAPQYTITIRVSDGENTAEADMTIEVQAVVVPPTGLFSFIENFDSYIPDTGNLDVISNSDWVKQVGDEGLAPIPVVNEGLSSGTTYSLELNNPSAIAVYDFQKLVDAPVSLAANVPFYYATYFNVQDLGAAEGNRIRVAVRVDDDSQEAAAWIRHIIGRYGGNINARLGLGNSNSNSGEISIDQNQTFQFLVKGVWNGIDTISYEYTLAPTLAEEDNVWIAASSAQTVVGTPRLGRIFISSTSTANIGKIGPIRLGTDYAQVVTEEINNLPVIADQTFSITEDVASGTIVGTVLASDSDTENLTFTITGGNEEGAYSIDAASGVLTTQSALDFDAVSQYLLTVEVSDGPNAVSAVITVNVTEVIEAILCSPLSVLPCDQIVVNTPVNLNFDGNGNGLADTGFTMVDPYSGVRLAEDGIPSNASLPAFEQGNMVVANGNLVLTANKGIAYLDNNAQLNTLGVGLQDINAPITIETKLLGITTGGGSAQAGIWFGTDDENFVKLNVNGNNVELRREINGLSANGADSPDQIQVNNVGTIGQDVTLRLVVDPIAETLTAFYAIADGAFVQLTKANFTNLALPAVYVAGKEINSAIGNASFSGVYATYRNGTAPGAIFDATFDYFNITKEAILSFDVAALNFSANVGETIAPQTAVLSATTGNPSFVLSDDPDAGAWLILPTNPVLGPLEFGIVENLAAGNYSTTVFAIDQPDLGYTNGELQISLVVIDGTVQTPTVAAVNPENGATGVSVSTSVSANSLVFPNLDENGIAGLDNATVNTQTVRLFKQGTATQIGATVNSTGGGDAINLVPSLPLEENTTYVFEIDGVQDTAGETFAFFTSTFTTGSSGTGPITDLDNVSFENAGVVGSAGKYATLTIGPDNKLYALNISGNIHRWDMNPDGSLANEEILTAWKNNYSARAAIGLAFDPSSTSSNLIAYISHQSGALSNAPDWDGKISRISGANLENEQLLITELPRSLRDHLTNSIAFRAGEPNALYFNQGSNSAGGKPDNSWGNREESLLTAATLRLDLNLLPDTASLPLNVRTTRNFTAIINVDVNSPTLDGLYNPYFVNAPLTLYATGIRNAYDLVWHSNGQLYVPANGTAGGSNAPASVNGMRRPDGMLYDYSNPLFPAIPESNGNNTQRDWLFRVNPNTSIGYYGHPNPYRGEYVLNRGDVDVNNAAYDGIQPDENYRGAAFDFEFNKSPNGVIEYQSDAENGNLKGALLVVRYSGSSDIIALVPDGPNGDIGTFKEGIPGFGGFQDPLDLIEDVSTGNIYVSDYGRSQIVLLTPNNQSSPTPLIALSANEFIGDAVAVGSASYSKEITLSNLGNAILENISAQITGADANQFSISSLPSTVTAQNSGSFTISFDPASPGPKSAILTLTGTNAESVVINLRGLGKAGTGGSNEPSLQWILDTQLGAGVVNVGDTDTSTNLINLPAGTTYNDLLGDEIDAQRFERAIEAPITLQVLGVYGPEANNPIVALGWYAAGNPNATNELLTVENGVAGNGQTLNPIVNGALSFDPGVESFGFYSRWPFFNNRQLFSEDALNTFTGAIPHHVRVYELPGEDNAYIIATEEHISGFDYQDIVIIARNVRPFTDTPLTACTPISTLDCNELAVALPFALDFDGTEGGLANTGFTMVDNPSARIAIDGPTSNPDVPGFEPSKLNVSNGNLIINASNGIAFVTNGPGTGTSSDVNSQINTLGVGIDADAYGNFSIETSIVNPYQDATNNSEQGGIWFGLNEDNFVKFVANVTGGLELRKEVNGVSVNGVPDQLTLAVPGLNSSTVGLRLYIDIAASNITAFYSLNGGVEVEMGSLPLPATYVTGNATYDNLSFAGVFATKRRELTADVNYTFENFAITSDNAITFEPVRINFSLPEDVPPTGYLVDSGLGYGDRSNNYSYGWLNVNGTSPLDLSSRARSRGVNGVGILQNTLIHMQYQNVDPTAEEGIWEIEVPNGNYNVSVGVGDPNVDGQEGTQPLHTINVEGVNAINRYSPTGVAGAATRFTSGMASVTVTDGRLTIDASGGFNTKINVLEITQGAPITQPSFANVSPANNATNVRIEDFQINVEVIVPNDYEIDISTLAGNINLFEITAGGDVLIPSNSNDTGGGDAITLTPTQDLKELTEYRFVLTSAIEANRRGELTDRIPFQAFESTFTTGEIDDENIPIRDLTGVEFTKVSGVANLGPGVDNQRFSSLVIGPDGKLYGSTIGNFSSDGQIYRWDMATDGTLSNLEILSPALQGSSHPVTGVAGNNDRLIIGLAFDPASTADNLIAYITHSKASITGGPEWDGKLTRLTGADLSNVEDILIHLPRSVNDHLTNSIIFDAQGDLYINQGSNSAGGDPDSNWGNRPERLLAAAVLKLEIDKLPGTLPLSVFTTDDIAVINAAPLGSILMSNGTYNPYATTSPLTIFSTGIRNAYDLVWHSNGWLYVPTNGTAGNNNTSPNSPATASYPLARRIDGLTFIPSVPALRGGETQKDWLFKTKGGSYHGHPNPYRGEFVLNHGGISYSGLPGQVEASYKDVAKYPNNLQPDPNYLEPAFDFGKNKSPNGAIEYKSDAFGGKLQGLLMVVRFSGQDDLLVLDPKTNGDIAEAYGSIPGLGGFDDPLDVIEDPKTGNIYISEYDRDNNGTARLTLLRAAIPATSGPEIAATPEELIFEVTTNNQGSNTITKTIVVSNEGNAVLDISGASISGNFGNQFDAVQPAGAVTIAPGASETYTITYAPDLNSSNLGYQDASLVIESNDAENPALSLGLFGLKKSGFEGGNEPPLQDVVNTLGIGIDVGWSSLSNGTNPNPIGDEVEVELWVKATDAPINVTPVGRYSPAEELPFGWYTNDNGLILNEIGVLEGSLAQAQTLFPQIASGDAFFDPLGAVFGFYTDSNTFNRTNYTEDALNAAQTSGVTHRTRIYPMADRAGNPIENSYLIAFEDASNGDYQDYMFVIDNVIPFEDGALALNFDKETLDFIVPINQENVPVQQLTLTGTGGITSQEVTLASTEEWVILPEIFDLGANFDVGIDISGLAIGTYQAIISASAPNYTIGEVTVNLDITNELIYTYQFNFQVADDVEISPDGYIDDFGAPYGIQSTANLGDLTYGWVLPGTLDPADASVNGRNRDSGIPDGVLLQTFTIIGHPTPANFPLRDWVVNVPNGTYSVNISVGERDFSNSNHILNVNGTNVVNFNQDTNNPQNLVYFNDTKLVEVTDGLMRMSLGTGGYNAKPNYIRLAPVNTSLIPPSIAATFSGNESAPNTYRGSVSVALEATDESDSGGIASLEYQLDGDAITSYTEPIVVSGVGAHMLVATAIDNNGNTTERTFVFTIEAPTGAILAIENMTKVPGTDRGFPADDYFTFHRLGNPGAALVHDSNVLRLNNTGIGELLVSEVLISDANDYSYELFDASGALLTGPEFSVPVGSYVDVDITFIGSTGNGNSGIFVERIEVVSNADNALANSATLHGAYSPQPEGGDEINAQEVFDAFGFQTSMLSIVNDAGTITPPNNLTFRPSSNFPIPANIDAGYEGDMILSDNFVQADPSKPVIGIQLSALHGGPGSNGARFVQTGTETGTVGGINFSHNPAYYQTLLPKAQNSTTVINSDTSTSISGPFRIAVSSYLTSGGNNINGNRPDLLGARVYKVIDHNGNVIPNEYIVLQDFVQGGCGAGSANCDWNDNTFYFINIRPEGVPSALPLEDVFVNVGEEFIFDVSENFDTGYPGNSLSYNISTTEGEVPSWIQIDASSGTISGTPPIDAPLSSEVTIEGVDANGLVASTTIGIEINVPPIAQDDEVTLFQNVVTLLDGLLTNDSEPNGQTFSITSVETPLNGLVTIQDGGQAVVYTPNFDFVGNDSFAYVIEDATGLSATANVNIVVAAENQAPVAVLESNVESGQAALFVEFTGSNSTDENIGSLNYAWDFGDGSGASNEADPSYTFTSAGVFIVRLTVTDSDGLFDVATKAITVSAPQNTAPTAVASISPVSGLNSLQFSFDASASTDSESALTYLWEFGDGSTSTEAVVDYLYGAPGTFDVVLTVTDVENLSNSITTQVVAKEPITGDFALRINAGGPALTYEGEQYSADQYAVGGKIYTNASAQVPELYRTERSARPPSFGYTIPLENGEYEVTLHFAEIYWGATGGSALGGANRRVFDVVIEGITVLDDFDINAEVGSQTVTTRTFSVTITDGFLNMELDALGSDGVNEPKLSAIEILGNATVVNEAPVAVATSDISIGTAPLLVQFDGSASSDDNGIVGYLWDFGDATPTSTEIAPSHVFENSGVYSVSFTVTDDAGESDTETIEITVEEVVVNLAPVAVATSDISIGTAPLLVQFDGSASSDDNGIVGYLWDFGDATPTSTEIAPSHVFENSGVYSVSFTVTDDAGESDTETIEITVEEVIVNLSPVADAGNDVTVEDTDGNGTEAVTLDGGNSTDMDGTIIGYLERERYRDRDGCDPFGQLFDRCAQRDPYGHRQWRWHW